MTHMNKGHWMMASVAVAAFLGALLAGTVHDAMAPDAPHMPLVSSTVAPPQAGSSQGHADMPVPPDQQQRHDGRESTTEHHGNHKIKAHHEHDPHTTHEGPAAHSERLNEHEQASEHHENQPKETNEDKGASVLNGATDLETSEAPRDPAANQRRRRFEHVQPTKPNGMLLPSPTARMGPQ